MRKAKPPKTPTKEKAALETNKIRERERIIRQITKESRDRKARSVLDAIKKQHC